MGAREIKFKVWDSEKKRMSEPIGVGATFLVWNDGDIDMPVIFAEAKSDRFTFLEYTGLKCRGNKEVYESGLLINPSGEVGLVVYYEGGFYLKCPRKGGYPFYVALTAGFLANKTQMGNVHENPEFLKGENYE